MLQETPLFDLERLKVDADQFARDFNSASPFPHIVIDGLLRFTPNDIESWPKPDWEGWASLNHAYSPNKRQADDITVIPEPMRTLIRQLSEPRFLRVLEQISGIKRLLPDPYLSGGGLHMSGPGGVLNPHTDFHHYRGLDIYRRINVLIYLNAGWSVEDGGCLTLYEKATDRPVRTVVPEWGRTVIFQTDDDSVHGFPQPIANGQWRRSIALYYYTAAETPNFSGDATTYWREIRDARGVIRKGRFALYRALLNLSRSVSVLAHLANPNQGVGLLRSVLMNRRAQSRR